MIEHKHGQQDHAHAHPHAHTHAHDHHHDEGDTYFIDQLCMVGFSGAFGMICLCLWFWQTKMLNLMLGAQFHLFVLSSGVVLVTLALTRGVVLWFQSRNPHVAHTHDHPHEGKHDHSHEHEHQIQEKSPHLQIAPPLPIHEHGSVRGHDHAPGEVCGHDHEHDHTHDGHVHGTSRGPAQHHHDHDEADHDHGWAPWRYVVVLIPVILFLLGLPNKPPTITGFQTRTFEFEQLFLSFTSIVYEALPFIVLGVLIAGLLEEFVPQQAIAKIIPRNRVLAILIGGILGLVFPMCECGIIVVMKRLLRKGLPLSVCVCYMLAGPVINVVVMTSTYVAFNPPQERDYILGGPIYVVALRVGLAYLVAFITALIVDWQWQRHGSRLLHPSVMRGLRNVSLLDDNGVVKRTWPERINNITQTALNDFIDILAFLILGAILAAGGSFLLNQTNIQELFQESPELAILIMMGIAVLFCLCSEADAFVAANFPLYWPPASKLAFLVLGPMLDLKLYLMYTRVFRQRLILTIISAVVVQVFAYSMIVDYFDTTPLPQSTQVVFISPEEHTYLASLAFGPDPLAHLAYVGAVHNPESAGKGEPVDFKTVYEELAGSPDLRNRWKGRVVEVRGQFYPYPGSNQVFFLCRLKRNCCANDAIWLKQPVISRESIDGIHRNDWVRVTAKIEFREVGGSFSTILVVSSRTDVVKVTPDTNPYVE